MRAGRKGAGSPAALAAAALLSAAAPAADYVPPRDEFGAPDLSGVWSIATRTDLERPPRFERLALSAAEARAFEERARAAAARADGPSDPERPAPAAGRGVGGYNAFWMDPGDRLAVVDGRPRSSILVEPEDGRLPYSERGRANLAAAMARRQSYDGPETRPVGERCMIGFGSTAGPPKLPVLYNNLTRIVQTRDHVVLAAEMNHDARIARIGGAPRRAPPFNRWLGDSRGRWEGDTLVVVTTGFHPQQSLRSSLDHRFYASPEMKVTERFTRTGEDALLYRFTVEDPENYSRPWSGELPMRRSDERMFEYACHEGNYALPGILAGARRAEAEGTDYAPTDPGFAR